MAVAANANTQLHSPVLLLTTRLGFLLLVGNLRGIMMRLVADTKGPSDVPAWDCIAT